MRCLKSVNTDRRDAYHRAVLKGVLSWFFMLCLLFLIHNFFVPGEFSPKYNGIAFLGLVLLYPIHKGLHILASFKYRSGMEINLIRRFYIVPCIQVRVKSVIPKGYYLFSLLFPFFFILALLVLWALFIPIWNSPVFLILLAAHIGMSYPDFIIANNLRNLPKNCFVEDAKRGYSILISD
ncbi:hypothetical protein MFLO_00035 [Listeria floridensis FSL S10-1187]|uniref:DUF3267 domain-containing protein n=1 Tax=Listeria floridensis FSL S10-1187 TaxID=1265817 RepID=A0ABP3B162_9LIST|nr:metalloprotease family protein [Listeria floridensis]EUJ33599.1 hypothetical protein MFLO_00035 [Listeria floridensis FSL S10-1187]